MSQYLSVKPHYPQAEVTDKLNSDSTPLEMRRANDMMMQFDRAFLVDAEIPGTMFYSKNILVSPSSSNLYTGMVSNFVRVCTPDIGLLLFYFRLCEFLSWYLYANKVVSLQ